MYGGWLVGVKKALLLGTRKSSNTLHVTRKQMLNKLNKIRIHDLFYFISFLRRTLKL